MFLETWKDVSALLGIGFPDLFIGLVFLAGIIVMAKDTKIGAIFYLLMYTVGFIFFQWAGLETQRVLIAMFLSLLIMAIMLYSRKSSGGIY